MEAVKKYKYITLEVVKEGSIEIRYSEEESEKIKEVNEYNSYMNECKKKMKDLKKICHNYLIINYSTLVFLFFLFFPDFLLVQDTAFYILYTKKKGCLGEEPGYPLFCEIKIDWIRGKKYNSHAKVLSDLKVSREL